MRKPKIGCNVWNSPLTGWKQVEWQEWTRSIEILYILSGKLGEKYVDQHTLVELESDDIQLVTECPFICQPTNEADICTITYTLRRYTCQILVSWQRCRHVEQSLTS